jgi:hypothetical protein
VQGGDRGRQSSLPPFRQRTLTTSLLEIVSTHAVPRNKRHKWSSDLASVMTESGGCSSGSEDEKAGWRERVPQSGEQPDRGEKMLADLSHQQPKFNKTGHRELPRSWLAPQWLREVCPCRSQMPYPLSVRAAIICRMMLRGRRSMGSFTWMLLSTNCSPSHFPRPRFTTTIHDQDCYDSRLTLSIPTTNDNDESGSE